LNIKLDEGFCDEPGGVQREKKKGPGCRFIHLGNPALFDGGVAIRRRKPDY
jgi:hypothetical protein